MSEVDAALAIALSRVAEADRLLVAADFDGTLAPIAELPDAVVADNAACEALQALSELPDTLAAIISGRALSVLRGFLGTYQVGLRLIGSHGAEWDRGSEGEDGGESEDGNVASPSERQAREDVTRAFESIARRHPGALVERKPFGVAFHYRGVSAARQGPAAQEARDALRDLDVRSQEGRKVVEGIVREADKGATLDALRKASGVSATLFIGDDVTDEHAFARLTDPDLGVKVGPGPTHASARVPGQEDVALLLRRLYVLRRQHLDDLS
jgi:trehalose 6-phosphate phosphatase